MILCSWQLTFDGSAQTKRVVQSSDSHKHGTHTVQCNLQLRGTVYNTVTCLLCEFQCFVESRFVSLDFCSRATRSRIVYMSVCVCVSLLVDSIFTIQCTCFHSAALYVACLPCLCLFILSVVYRMCVCVCVCVKNITLKQCNTLCLRVCVCRSVAVLVRYFETFNLNPFTSKPISYRVT